MNYLLLLEFLSASKYLNFPRSEYSPNICNNVSLVIVLWAFQLIFGPFNTIQVVNEPVGVHSPVVDIPTRSKLSCVNWNKCSKNIIASSDYEGIVNIWDVNTKQVLFL